MSGFDRNTGGQSDPSNTQGKGPVPGTPEAIPTVDAVGVKQAEADAFVEGPRLAPEPVRILADLDDPDADRGKVLKGQPTTDTVG